MILFFKIYSLSILNTVTYVTEKIKIAIEYFQHHDVSHSIKKPAQVKLKYLEKVFKNLKQKYRLFFFEERGSRYKERFIM